MRSVLPEVNARMAAKFAEIGESSRENGLDQEGLLDGNKIVTEFLQANEIGEAFYHLCYMIVEAELSISDEAYASLKAVGNAMELNLVSCQGADLKAFDSIFYYYQRLEELHLAQKRAVGR